MKYGSIFNRIVHTVLIGFGLFAINHNSMASPEKLVRNVVASIQSGDRKKFLSYVASKNDFRFFMITTIDIKMKQIIKKEPQRADELKRKKAEFIVKLDKNLLNQYKAVVGEYNRFFSKETQRGSTANWKRLSIVKTTRSPGAFKLNNKHNFTVLLTDRTSKKKYELHIDGVIKVGLRWVMVAGIKICPDKCPIGFIDFR